MDDILTLVASRDLRNGLNQQVLTDIAETLEGQDVSPGDPVWLSADLACDIPYEGNASYSTIENTVRACLGDSPIDLMVGPNHGRRKRLLIADMDQTIITRETMDEMAAHAGLGEEIAAITARTMRGELEFEEALRERLSMLKGLSEDALRKTLEEIEPTPGAGEFVATMNAQGACTALVSGGFTYFTEPVKARLGFQHAVGNVLGIEDRKLTGSVIGPIVGRSTKVEVLVRLAGELGVSPEDALTIGDGANDLGMIEAAGLGIAYYGKPVLAAAARARIEHTDLRTALYFQGYSDAEIIPG